MSNPPSALEEVKDLLAISTLRFSDLGLDLSFSPLLQTLNHTPERKQDSQGFRVLAGHLSNLQQLITTLNDLSPGVVRSLHLLPLLDREIKNFQSAFEEAIHKKKIDLFLDNLNDVESIVAYNDKICQAIQLLGGEVDALTKKPEKPQGIYSGMTIVQQEGSSAQEGMARMRAQFPSNPGDGIFFHKVRIDTTAPNGQPGGGVLNDNEGFPTVILDDVDIKTGGGEFGQGNKHSPVQRRPLVGALEARVSSHPRSVYQAKRRTRLS